MESEKLQETAFQIILSSGDARTIVHEAFQEMRQGTFEAAQAKLDRHGDHHGPCTRSLDDNDDFTRSGD